MIDNKKSLGSWTLLGNPLVSVIAADSNLDFLCLDLEHGIFTWENVETSVSVLQHSGKVAVIRIGEKSQLLIQKSFDTGADYVQVAGLRKLADINEIFEMAEPAPKGNRGYSPWVRSSNSKKARESQLIPQIESISLLEELLQSVNLVPEIANLFLGRYDLSASCGEKGDLTSEMQLKLALNFANFCESRGIIAWTIAVDNIDARMMLDYGFKNVSLSSDRQAVKANFENIQGLNSP